MCRFVVFWSLLLAAAVPSTGLAFGPGAHIREAHTTLELVIEKHPQWQAYMESALAIQYLRLGSISPDLQHGSTVIDFGHGKALSYHLLDLAEDMEPRFKLFALGHLSHAGGGDPASEQFLAPMIIAGAPLGMFDITAGSNGPMGETEGITEGYGDIFIGDWDALVEVVFAFWLDGGEAKARMEEIVGWYCEEGAAFYGKSLDCGLAIAEFIELAGEFEGLLAGMTVEEGKELVQMLLGQPVEDIADLIFGGMFGGFMGDKLLIGPHFEEELERFKNSVLADPDYWLLYEEMQYIGPSVSLYYFEERPPGNSWPLWVDKPLVWGNVRSIMNFLSSAYAPHPGLLIDELVWRDPAGNTAGSVPTAPLEGEYSVTVRYYAGLPFSGTVRGAVRKDSPGLDDDGDASLGEAEMALTVDPTEYGPRQREELVIPFVPDTAGALGFYVELHRDDDELAWATTNWDKLWQIPNLPFHWEVYKNNFGTYGHWPPSLPVADAEGDTLLFATMRVAYHGPGIPGAKLTVAGLEYVAGQNGMIVLEQQPGMVNLTVEAPGFALKEPVLADLVAGTHNFVDVPLHPLPQVDVPAPYWSSNACFPVTFDASVFAGQPTSYLGTLTAVDAMETVVGDATLTEDGIGELCPGPDIDDGTQVQVGIIAEYLNEDLGVPGLSDPFVLDGSGPSIELIGEPAISAVWCPGMPGYLHKVEVAAMDPHSPVTAFLWRRVGEPKWSEIPVDFAKPGKDVTVIREVDTGLLGPDNSVEFKAVNAAAEEGEVLTVVFAPTNPCLPEPDGVVEVGPDIVLGPDTVLEVVPEIAAADSPSPEDSDTAGGCTASGSSGAAMLPLLLLLAALFATRHVGARSAQTRPCGSFRVCRWPFETP